MKLVDDWKKSWRMLSVQLSFIWTAATAAWLLIPKDQQEALLKAVGLESPGWLALVGFVSIIWGRLQAQPKLHE